MQFFFRVRWIGRRSYSIACTHIHTHFWSASIANPRYKIEIVHKFGEFFFWATQGRRAPSCGRSSVRAVKLDFEIGIEHKVNIT